MKKKNVFKVIFWIPLFIFLASILISGKNPHSDTNPKYKPLFEPFTLNNGVIIKNRLVVAPMTHYSSDENGHLTNEERDFIGIRAQDFGMFITASTLVAHGGKSFIGEPYAIDKNDLKNLTETAKIIKSQGAKAILQLHYGGLKAINENEVKSPNDMTDKQIKQLIKAFANATKLAIQAKFDGIEIHGANGYVIQQFFSEATNQRTDKWGGNAEKRANFPLAVIDACLNVRKSMKAPNFIIGYRLSPEETPKNGLTMDDTLLLLDKILVRKLDYIHVSTHDFFSKGNNGIGAGDFRLKVIKEKIAGRTALIGVGGLRTAEDVKEAFDTKYTDFIAVGKASMINPNFATLIATGRENEIQTELFQSKKESYKLPERLWKMCEEDRGWLPKIIK